MGRAATGAAILAAYGLLLVACGAGTSVGTVESPRAVTWVMATTTSTATLAPSTVSLRPATSGVTPSPALPTALPDQATLERGEITSRALAGNLFGDPATRAYRILLPPGYATGNKRYPVVYALHLFGGNEDTLTGPMTRDYAEARAAGAIRDMIVVFPNAGNSLGGSWYLGNATIGDYDAYLSRELVEHVDANYRTLPQRDGRGIMGCSMGGYGAIHMGMTHPDVYGAAAGVSGPYDWSDFGLAGVAERVGPGLDQAFTSPADLSRLAPGAAVYTSRAAAAAPNPDAPPLYFDLPFRLEGGEGQTDLAVTRRIIGRDAMHDAQAFEAGPEALRGMLIYHGASDNDVPVAVARGFDALLTDLGIEHEYLEVAGGHCDLDYAPVLEFMSERLAFD